MAYLKQAQSDTSKRVRRKKAYQINPEMETEKDDSKSKAEDHYRQLADSRDFDAQKKKAKEAMLSNSASSKKTRLIRKRKRKTKGVAKETLKNPGKMAISAGTAFTKIRPGADFMYFIIIIISIIADIFGLIGLIPYLGSVISMVFAFFFSVLIWILYAMKGHFKKRWKRKVFITGSAQLFEILGIGMNILPVFTLSAVFNYWFILTERKMAASDQSISKSQK